MMGIKNNNLLKENTIRRFMKLANVETLTDNFFQEGLGVAPRDSEAEKEKAEKEKAEKEKAKKAKKPAPQKEGAMAQPATPGMAEDEEQLEEQMDDEPEMDMDDEPEMDMDDEPEMDMEPDMDEPGAADISLTEEEAELLISLGERLSQAMESELGGEDSEEMGDMGDMDDMGDMAVDSEPEEEEEPGMGIYENKEQIIKEVLNRVTKRLVNRRR